jgi:hypothetical protein
VSVDQPGAVEIPTFSECVVGYRAWLLDGQGRLWPTRGSGQPWEPGVNTARCECGISDRLHFVWSTIDDKHVLTPAPLHEAPEETCACGLYSLRQPRRWTSDPAFLEGRAVAGAVASWGRLQVHATGLRAEHACVVALGRPDDAPPATLERIGRYRVEVVSYQDLPRAALKHGSPLPDAIHDAVDDLDATASTPVIGPVTHPAPDATVDEVRAVDEPSRGLQVRRAHLAVLIAAVLAALILLLIVFDHRSTPCKLQITYVAAGGTIEQCASQTITHQVTP